MKIAKIIQIMMVLLLVCSCSREESLLSDYRDLAKELKENSADYTEQDWENLAANYQKLEEKAERCKFSPDQKKELNKLRGQCVAYLFKAVTKQSAEKVIETINDMSDMVEGFNEALKEDDIEGAPNNIDD